MPLKPPPLSILSASQHYPSFPAAAGARISQGLPALALSSRFQNLHVRLQNYYFFLKQSILPHDFKHHLTKTALLIMPKRYKMAFFGRIDVLGMDWLPFGKIGFLEQIGFLERDCLPRTDWLPRTGIAFLERDWLPRKRLPFLERDCRSSKEIGFLERDCRSSKETAFLKKGNSLYPLPLPLPEAFLSLNGVFYVVWQHMEEIEACTLFHFIHAHHLLFPRLWASIVLEDESHGMRFW